MKEEDDMQVSLLPGREHIQRQRGGNIIHKEVLVAPTAAGHEKETTDDDDDDK